MPRVRLALLLALAALVALPASAGAVLGGVNGRIMFVSGRDTGNSQTGLFMRTILGSQGAGDVFPAVAPVGMEQERHPSWSPDRRRVVYARGTPFTGPYAIHIAELTEVADTTLTDVSQVSADHPAWSPDGTKIAWDQGNTTGNKQTDIFVYDLRGGVLTNLTETPGANESKPAWSPDSQTIFYAKGDQAANTLNVYSRPVAGGTPETVRLPTSTGIDQFQPSISPDGTKICYTLLDGTGPQSGAEVLVGPLTNPPTGGQILTTDDGPPNGPNVGNYDCTWSPDGRFIAFTRGFSDAAVMMMHSDFSDTAATTLVDNTPNVFDGSPDWAPDGPPKCNDSQAQVVQGKTVQVRMPCHDTGPKYEQTDVTETPAFDAHPAHGKLGTPKQGNPSTVPYTANAKYTGPDSFEFAGLGINGGSDRGLASILVLKKGRCANMKTGNAGHNVLNGTIGGDRLLGLNGKDVLRGFAGRDCLFGGAGNDTLNGGLGGDKLVGEDGRDRLIGGPGGDNLNGGKGKDRFDGGRGNDRILAADGRAETVNCGAGKKDRATLDHNDTQHGCEHVTRK